MNSHVFFSSLFRWVFLSLRCEAIEFISLYTFMVSFIPASLRHTEQNLYYFILVIKIDVGCFFFLNKWKKWFVYLMKNFSVFGCKQTNSNRRTCIIIIIKRHVRRISNWNVRGAQPWRGIPDAAAVESRSRVAKLVFCQVFYFYFFISCMPRILTALKLKYWIFFIEIFSKILWLFFVLVNCVRLEF